jgi:hypothetical protein
MARFRTVLKSARFVYSPYTATEMKGFAQVLAGSIRARIESGKNHLYDQAAVPLKPGQSGRPGYPDYKSAPAYPRLDLERANLRCLKVLSANENRAAIGSLDEASPRRRQTASQIAAFNNRREAQWGVSRESGRACGIRAENLRKSDSLAVGDALLDVFLAPHPRSVLLAAVHGSILSRIGASRIGLAAAL